MGSSSRRSGRKPLRPATTLEGRENQLISLAYDFAERVMRDGSASSQIVTSFLKLGSTREKLEQEKIKNENLLLAAKIEELAGRKVVEELYRAALKAMKIYTGQDTDDDVE
jgi:hypothetical protein